MKNSLKYFFDQITEREKLEFFKNSFNEVITAIEQENPEATEEAVQELIYIASEINRHNADAIEIAEILIARLNEISENPFQDNTIIDPLYIFLSQFEEYDDMNITTDNLELMDSSQETVIENYEDIHERIRSFSNGMLQVVHRDIMSGSVGSADFLGKFSA